MEMPRRNRNGRWIRDTPSPIATPDTLAMYHHAGEPNILSSEGFYSMVAERKLQPGLVNDALVATGGVPNPSSEN